MRKHDLALATVRWGRSLGPNWELVGELFGGQEVMPSRRSVFGLTAVTRYNLATGSAWVPFFDLGFGITTTSIRGDDLSTAFQFNDQAGIGAHFFLGDHRAVTLQCRWLHISNAGIKLPNHGTNTVMMYGGLSWFF